MCKTYWTFRTIIAPNPFRINLNKGKRWIDSRNKPRHHLMEEVFKSNHVHTLLGARIWTFWHVKAAKSLKNNGSIPFSCFLFQCPGIWDAGSLTQSQGLLGHSNGTEPATILLCCVQFTSAVGSPSFSHFDKWKSLLWKRPICAKTNYIMLSNFTGNFP